MNRVQLNCHSSVPAVLFLCCDRVCALVLLFKFKLRSLSLLVAPGPALLMRSCSSVRSLGHYMVPCEQLVSAYSLAIRERQLNCLHRSVMAGLPCLTPQLQSIPLVCSTFPVHFLLNPVHSLLQVAILCDEGNSIAFMCWSSLSLISCSSVPHSLCISF